MHRKKDDYLEIVFRQGVKLIISGIIIGLLMGLFSLIASSKRIAYCPFGSTAEASVLPNFWHKKDQPKPLHITTKPQEVEVTTVNADNSLTVRGENTYPKRVKLLLLSYPPKGCYGHDTAHKELIRLTKGKIMWIFTDKQAQNSNYVYLQKDSKIIQERILEQGDAVIYNYNGSERYFYNMQNAQQKAKEQAKGVWLAPGYVTDNGYDKKVGHVNGN